MPALDSRLGARGEDLAASHLKLLGFEILERNFRARSGEIDIVAQDGEYIVFVEVKARRPGRFGRAAEQITSAKRRRIVRTARAYIAARGLEGRPCRFDVVAIDILPGGTAAVDVVEGAFDG